MNEKVFIKKVKKGIDKWIIIWYHVVSKSNNPTETKKGKDTMINEKDWYIQFVDGTLCKPGHGTVTKEIGPMTKDKANRWFNNIDRMDIDLEDGYCIRMVYGEQVEHTFEEILEKMLRHEYYNSCSWEIFVSRIFIKTCGMERADSFDVYDIEDLFKEKANAIAEVAKEDGWYSNRVLRLASRMEFIHWLRETGYKVGYLR